MFEYHGRYDGVIVMIKKIRNMLDLKRLDKDNRGSAIVMVIIALAFIAILGVTIMWMSLSNFRMKVTDSRNKQGFYTAETVFEQIKAGLQGDASEASDLAYSYVMQNYHDWDEDKREAEFKREFKKSLIKIISEDGTGSTTEFKVSHLSRYIDGNLNISIDNTHKGTPIRYLGARKSGVIGDKGDIEGTALSYAGDETAYIVLKDIVLEYTDDDGFYSEINTDIMITAPTTSFIDSSSLPPVFKYAMIADEGIDVGDGKLTVNGGIYSGSDGIRVGSGKELDINNFNSEYTISKGPIVATKNSTVKISGGLSGNNILYASDLEVDQANLDISGDTRIADDLSIAGNGSGYSVKLSGRYYGFGADRFKNSDSSAVVINGLNTNLNLSNLNKMVLAGRSFVATSKAREQVNGVDTGDPKDLSGNSVPVYTLNPNYDVKMGESIAVKGNQLAYLVPSECIAVGSKSVKGKNPMTWGELASFTAEKNSDPGLQIVDYKFTRLAWADNQPLDYFMPASSDNYIQKVFAPSNGEVLCYFYVVLDDNKMINITTPTPGVPAGTYDAASLYSQWYYEAHKTKLDRYMDVYAPSVTLPADSNIWAAATLISSSGPGGLKEHKTVNPLSSAEKDDCDLYRSTYKGYCWDLTGNAIDAAMEATLSSNNLVYEHTMQVSANNITDPETNIRAFLDDSDVLSRGGGRNRVSVFEVPAAHAHGGLKALLVDAVSPGVDFFYVDADGTTKHTTKDVYVYNDTTDKIRIIISTKDILLKQNFNGIIVTDGKIYTAAGVTVKGIVNDLDMKEEVMDVLGAKFDDSVGWAKNKPASWRPIDLFRNGATYIGTSDSGSGLGDIDIDSSVNFRNWIKN